MAFYPASSTDVGAKTSYEIDFASANYSAVANSCNYYKIGDNLIYIEANINHTTGATTASIGTIPNALRPTRAHALSVSGVGTDGSTFVHGSGYINSSGELKAIMEASCKNFYVSGVYSLS